MWLEVDLVYTLIKYFVRITHLNLLNRDSQDLRKQGRGLCIPVMEAVHVTLSMLIIELLTKGK